MARDPGRDPEGPCEQERLGASAQDGSWAAEGAGGSSALGSCCPPSQLHSTTLAGAATPELRYGHPQPDAPQRPPQAAAAKARPHQWLPPAQRLGAEDHDPQAQEAQLGQPQVCPCAAQQWQGGHLLHPGRRAQPAGAQHRPGGGWEDAGPARGQAQGRAGKV